MLKEAKLNRLQPFVKWAGGKTQLLDKLHFYMPLSFNKYYEPFVGGGSFFLSIAPNQATINDQNKELINAYECIKSEELFHKLLNQLKHHELNHSEAYYYEQRNLDRYSNFEILPKYIRAARMIYLNKACFNGLYRVNSNGWFNVSYGNKEVVKTFNQQNMWNLHEFFNKAEINILNCDFEEAIKDTKEKDFIYFDPPYDTEDTKKGFTSYTQNKFDKEDQIRLFNIIKKISREGVFIMLSNRNTKFINELYKDFNIHVVSARHMINCDAKGRGLIQELIITNY